MRKGIVIFVTLASAALAASPQVEKARQLYHLTEFEQSLAVLQAIPEKTPEVLELTGCNLYMQGDYKKATEILEKALNADPGNSMYALWLGRAYGRRAETSTFFTAPASASKARQYFEKAVELNPRNLEAMSDLFEYYMEAPGFLGGGLDKAQALAAKIAVVEPAEGHWVLAKLAEKKKEFGTAEDHLRRASEAAPMQVGRLLDLAKFFTKQGRIQEADQNLAKAEKIAPDSPRVWYAKADLYIQSNRNLGAAKELLKRYLNATLTPDDPPRSEAQRLLRQAQGS